MNSIQDIWSGILEILAEGEENGEIDFMLWQLKNGDAG